MKRLRDFFEDWISGVNCITEGELTTFYTYFSIVISEIICLWVGFQEIALPFTILGILSMLNILICANLKGNYEGTKRELIVACIYVLVFVAIFIAGFFFNWLANLVLFLVPFILTGILSFLNEYTSTIFVGNLSKIEKKISNILENPVVGMIARVLVIGLPFLSFTLSILSTHFAIALKCIIIIGYALLVPVYAYLEDELAACNIFEIATWVLWSKEYEQAEKELERKLAENPEAFEEEVIAAAKTMLGELEKIEQMVDEKMKK